MLCLSCCPGKGEVSPLQPSSPLGLLAASSGGPPLWRLETVQSGVVGALVVHEQTPRQPLVPCSREAFERQSQRRTCGLQIVLIPCKRHPPSGGPPGPTPLPGEGNQAPTLREETRMLCGCYKTAVETKILLALGSAFLLPIRVLVPSSDGHTPSCSFVRVGRASAAMESSGAWAQLLLSRALL